MIIIVNHFIMSFDKILEDVNLKHRQFFIILF